MEWPWFDNRILSLLSQVGGLSNGRKVHFLRPAVPQGVVVSAGGYGLHEPNTGWLWVMPITIVRVRIDAQVFGDSRVDGAQSLEGIGRVFDFANGVYEEGE